MEKIFRWLGVSLATVALTLGVVGTLAVPVVAEEADATKVIEPRSQTAPGDTNSVIPEPTFDLQSGGLADDQTINLRMGNNRLLLANDLAASETVPGLLFSAGNTLGISGISEYGFLAGNLVEISGTIEKDLFVAGNVITLTKTAQIGGDIFGAGNEFVINNDLQGDLSVTASTVKFKNGVKIAGNVNLDVEKIIFEGDNQIAGALTYNDTASVVGLENATYHEREVYHIVETEITVLDMLLEKLLSIAGLFLVMVVIVFLSPRLHSRIADESDAKRTVTNFAIGAWVLLLVPILAVLLLCTLIGAPLGLILIGLYIIGIYLSQGFAGLWLGHLVVEKLCKSKTNACVEVLVGIVILGILALIPYVGTLTGLLGLLLGLGLMVSQVRYNRNVSDGNNSTEEGERSNKKPTQIAKSSVKANTKNGK